MIHGYRQPAVRQLRRNELRGRWWPTVAYGGHRWRARWVAGGGGGGGPTIGPF
jgi:hypothetical protein